MLVVEITIFFFSYQISFPIAKVNLREKKKQEDKIPALSQHTCRLSLKETVQMPWSWCDCWACDLTRWWLDIVRLRSRSTQTLMQRHSPLHCSHIYCFAFQASPIAPYASTTPTVSLTIYLCIARLQWPHIARPFYSVWPPCTGPALYLFFLPP